MKKAIIIISTIALIIVGIGGYWMYRRFSNQKNQLTTDEIHERLAEIFESVEYSLDFFVDYLKENDLLEALKKVGIDLPTDEESAMRRMTGNTLGWTRLVIYNGEVIEVSSDAQVVEFFVTYPELLGFLKELSNQGIIDSIAIADVTNADVWITFEINPDHTPFLTLGDGGAPGFFRYIAGSDSPEHGGNTHIRDNWYMGIRPPMP